MNEHKQSKFIIDVSSQAKVLNRSTTRFFSYDSHTAEIVIQAEKDGKLIDQALVDTVEIYFESVNMKYRPIDGLKWNDTMEISADGLYSYILPDDFLNYEGLVAFDVYINYKNGDRADSSNRIIFEQRVSAIDRAAGAVELVYIKDMEDAKQAVADKADEVMADMSGYESSLADYEHQIKDGMDQLYDGVANVSADEITKIRAELPKVETAATEEITKIQAVLPDVQATATDETAKIKAQLPIVEAVGTEEIGKIRDVLSTVEQTAQEVSDHADQRIAEYDAKFVSTDQKMQELDQRIDEQTEIFNNADVYNKAEIEDKLEPFALRTDIAEVSAQLAHKADKAEVANGLTAKGASLYASLPTTGNNIGDYYYCSDGNGVDPSGNYVWNGASWYFGGTGDNGYNQLKEKLSVKVSYNDMIYGKKFLSDDDFKAGYLAVSTGIETANTRGIFTTEFLESGTVIDVTDSSLVAVALYSFKKSDNTFNSAAEKITTPFTLDSDISHFKALFYYKETGLYGNISTTKANELKKYAIVKLDEDVEVLATNEKIGEFENRISEVEGNINSYYLEGNYIQNKVNEINDNMCQVGVNGETFVFITDPHWDLGNAKQSPKLIKYIKEHTNIDNVICGGDIINEGLHDDMRDVFLDFVNEMKKLGGTVPIAFGNHDSNANTGNPSSEWFDDNTVLNLQYKHVLKDITFIAPAHDRSFTYDLPKIKTLFVFLDTRTTGALKWETITPFSSLFNTVPDGYKVVVVAHWLISNNALTSWGQRITDTIDAYNNRGSYTNDQNSVTYNYGDAKGKCVLILCGHTHYDSQIVTNGGVPLLNTTCDNYNRSGSELVRTPGTITEQAFDVITINYSDDSIKAVRIGSGNDRSFSGGVWSIS